ncbi:MAG: CCA tRNA nucleotidyltransferase [Nanoarchaeota archaeon]|nr:CCA tRNA nucleotidyltransferase [Nanoarchaeota archaeon]
MELLKQVIDELRPKKDVVDKCTAVLNSINSGIKKKKIRAMAVLGGSIAKGTFLKNDYDCDIFVKFSLDCKKKDISDLLEKVLKDFPKVNRIHGSRDYFNFKLNRINFEIIPVLDIKKAEQAMNITDCSPLHVKWVKDNLKKNLRLTDEIRLAKAFCKAFKVYGAESYMRGFSGHVLDVLVIYYKGFIPLLKNAVKWKEQEVIDFNNYYNGNALERLNKSKLGPLVVIDPIQPERNAAAVLSKENFLLFKKSATSFLKKPLKKFFEKKEITIKELKDKSKHKKLVLLNVKAFEGKEDVVGSKLLKAFNYINKNLVLNGFTVYDKGWKWDKKKNSLFWFILKHEILPESLKRIGPPIKNKENVKQFMKKHRKTFIQGKRICANVKREFRKPEELIKFLKKTKYLKEKAKKIEIFIY